MGKLESSIWRGGDRREIESRNTATCHADHQEVGRCGTRDGSEELHISHYVRIHNMKKVDITLALKPIGDFTTNPEQG